MSQLKDLISLREKTLSHFKEISQFPEVELSSQFISELETLIQEEMLFQKYSFNYYSTQDNFAIISNQYFLIAKHARDILDALFEYLATLRLIIKKFPNHKEVLYNAISDDEESGDYKRIADYLRTKSLDNDSIKFFFRFLRDSSFRGGKEILNKPHSIIVLRGEDDYIGSCILESLGLIKNSTEYVGKLLFKTLDNHSLYMQIMDGDAFKSIDSITEKIVYPLSHFSHNRIIYGAPGTGKSYLLKHQVSGDYVFRVTFNPEYSYGDFVGSLRPSMKEDKIIYSINRGPFLKALIASVEAKQKQKNVYLIIEELNRANVASVFGDIFQLLDRDERGKSEFGINLGDELEKELKKEEFFDQDEDADGECLVKLPENLFIWATMNSADQGVFPLDTAFKRRWPEI